MLNLLISCDDPMERLLYGEPDPWLGLMMPRHDADGRGHTHHGSSLDDVIAQDQGYGGGGNQSGDHWSYSEPYNSDGYDGGDGAIGSGPGGGGGSDDFGPADADGYEGPSPSFTTDEPDRPQTPAERDFDAFLIRQTRTEAGDDFESGPSGSAGRQKGLEAGPDTLLRSPDGEDDDRAEIEALIISRGRALGLTEQQIAQALTRYRTGRVTSAARPDQITSGLGAATDPATALLGAGAHGGNTPSPASANPAERITRAGGSGEVLGTAEGDRDSRSAGSDGFGETRDVPTINPAYTEWEERNKIPLYLKADGEPLAPNELSVRGWYPAKETYPEFAARHGVDVVLNPNYVEPGERPNQYLDGSGQPVPETWEQAVAAYQRDAEPLRRDAARYETEATAYRTDFDAYETAVNAWNENPGSAAELKALQDQRERLATERARLSASADTINARAQARQAAAQNLNDLAKLKPGRQRNSVIRATAGPPEVREARYREAVERYEAAKNAPSIVYEYDDGEYIEGSLAKGRARRDNINQAKIELALTAVASGRPVPDGLRVSGTYRIASLSDAATPVELAQLVKQWRESESGAERADDPGGGGGGGSGRDYTVADDGTVSYAQDGHTYTVSDEDLAQDVREAAATGDASGLSSVDQVTVSTGDGGPAAAVNYNVGGDTSAGNYGELRGAQEAWFREQLANLPDDPAEAAARLAELSARADELNAEWPGRDATFVGPDGQPITGAEYFAQVSASLSAGANENTVIADRNAALPDAVAPVTTTFQPNAGLGDRFNADRSAIDARVAAANAIEDPGERAETLAALASDIRDLQEQWTGTDTRGWTLGVDHDHDPDTPRAPTTAPEWWGDYAAGIETAADANRATAEQNTAAAFASDSEALAIAESLGFDVSEITPDQARNLIAGYNEQVERRQEDERERQQRTLPGETGQIGTQVQVDPVTGSLQVSPGVMPAVAAALDERERQERTLPGETGQIGTQVQVDPVTGSLQVSPGVMPAVAAALDERERQERTLPGETGQIGTQVQVDPVTGALQVSPGVMPAVAAALGITPGDTCRLPVTGSTCTWVPI